MLNLKSLLTKNLNFMKTKFYLRLIVLFATGIINAQTYSEPASAGNQIGDNTFLGEFAGSGCTAGLNVFIGYRAGQVTTNEYNTFVGYSAGIANTSGRLNTFIGARSVGRNNTTGYENTFVGTESGENNTVGIYNTFIGKGAGRHNITGVQNTYLGAYSGSYNQTGSYNIGIGAAGSVSGSNNIFMGSGSVGGNNTADHNVMIGTSAGTTVTSGGHNLLLGRYSGYDLTTGNGNVFLGYAQVRNQPSTATSAGNDTSNSIILATGNSNQKLFIHSNGNTGIGLGNNVIPQNKLDVKGGVAIGAAYMNTLTVAGPTAPANGLIVQGNVGIGNSAPANRLEITSASANASGLRFTNLNFNYAPPANTAVSKFLTLTTTGDVILREIPTSGTATTVSNSIAGGQLTTTVNGVASTPVTLPSGGSGCNIYTCDNSIDTTTIPSTITGVRTVTMGNNNLYFKTNATDDGTGRLYIGSTMNTLSFPAITATSRFRLMVEGGILTERVKVALRNPATNWADYVFADDYKLMPLSEVESFVKENKHLPGIESAEELGKQGLDLGDMQAKQMGKIEELTLYVIDQNKIIEKQGKEIQELKAMVNALLQK